MYKFHPKIEKKITELGACNYNIKVLTVLNYVNFLYCIF